MMQGGAALASRPSVHSTRGPSLDSAASRCGLFQSRRPLKVFRRLPGDTGRVGPGIVPTSVSTSTSPESKLEENEDPEGAEEVVEEFNWNTQWYPILPISFADPSTPYPFTLLGKEMVLWRDKEGGWSCLEDRCSHRQVPLSRGRFNKDDGNLMCSFHGWTFNREGKCTHIPQAEAKREKMLCDGKRSRVQSYPVMVKHDAIWVWPDESPKAWVEASMTGTQLPKEMETLKLTGMFIQPVPYIYAAEMLMDPTHAPFAHEGSFAFSPSDATSCDIQVEDFGPEGIKLSVPGYTIQQANSKFPRQFSFPCTSVTHFNLPAQGDCALVIMCVPSLPGECRVVEGTYLAPPKNSVNIPRMIGKFVNVKNWLLTLIKMPGPITALILPKSWRIGLRRSKPGRSFVNQDFFIGQGLHKALLGQEHLWEKNYYMPTQSDAGVSAIRRWLDKYSKGSVKWAPGTPPDAPVPLEQVFEQWNYLTKHCVHSKKTVKGLLALQALVKKAAVVCFVASMVIMFVPSKYSWGLPGLAVAATCMLVAQWLEWRVSFFYDSVPPGSPPGDVDLYYRKTVL